MRKKENKTVASTYPSAELLQEACRDDYLRLINTYDQINNKVNMALAFCGVILVVIINSYDPSKMVAMVSELKGSDKSVYLVLLILSTASISCLTWAVIDCLIQIKSREITVFDSMAIRSERIYEGKPEDAALWLIQNYTVATKSLKGIVDKKQDKFNSTITKIVIALVAYIVYVVVSKGV